MTIEVSKVVSVTISLEDIQKLVNTCECARVYLDSKHYHPSNDNPNILYGQWTNKEAYDIRCFIERIFDMGLT